MWDHQCLWQKSTLDGAAYFTKVVGRTWRHSLQTKLEDIDNVYLIMNNIPIAVSVEDKNSLKNLRSQLKSIGGKVRGLTYFVKNIAWRILSSIARIGV